MDNNVIKNCGSYPYNFVKKEITSDPNFVFTDDPDFPDVTLWNVSGQPVVVHSFIECEHYVLGGWIYESNFSHEQSLQFNFSLILILFFSIYSFFKIYGKKRWKLKKE